jgi:hypothetical protein
MQEVARQYERWTGHHSRRFQLPICVEFQEGRGGGHAADEQMLASPRTGDVEMSALAKQQLLTFVVVISPRYPGLKRHGFLVAGDHGDGFEGAIARITSSRSLKALL